MRILIALLLAASLTGKWYGTVEIADSTRPDPIVTPVELELEQSGSALTGRIGRRGDADKVAIKNGRQDGDTITFEASSAETATPMKFTLKLDGAKMSGEMRGAVDAGQIVAKVSFAKQ